MTFNFPSVNHQTEGAFWGPLQNEQWSPQKGVVFWASTADQGPLRGWIYPVGKIKFLYDKKSKALHVRATRKTVITGSFSEKHAKHGRTWVHFLSAKKQKEIEETFDAESLILTEVLQDVCFPWFVIFQSSTKHASKSTYNDIYLNGTRFVWNCSHSVSWKGHCISLVS